MRATLSEHQLCRAGKRGPRWASLLGCTRYLFYWRFPRPWGVTFLIVDVFRVFGSGVFWQVRSWFVLFFFLGLVRDGLCIYMLSSNPLRSVSGLVRVIWQLICGTGHVSRVNCCRLWVFVVLDTFCVIFLLVFDVHFSLSHASSSPPPRSG